MILKLQKTIQENYRTIFIINIDAKILKILPNRIQQNIKRILGPDRVGFMSGIQGQFNKKKKKSMSVIYINNFLNDDLNNYRKTNKIEHPLFI